MDKSGAFLRAAFRYYEILREQYAYAAVNSKDHIEENRAIESSLIQADKTGDILRILHRGVILPDDKKLINAFIKDIAITGHILIESAGESDE